ncbi:hypothetical protein PVAP13_2NG044519 [Panicum virgatum]|uniref:Uncharacterized protein n=1 Tax=Panicum virgatum TaxID=38727 RepID=A0A8T0VJ40_PANVG|nr:hypothetical protein PVAP13_2NG044519 [Panicum virgatum]
MLGRRRCGPQLASGGCRGRGNAGRDSSARMQGRWRRGCRRTRAGLCYRSSRAGDATRREEGRMGRELRGGGGGGGRPARPRARGRGRACRGSGAAGAAMTSR